MLLLSHKEPHSWVPQKDLGVVVLSPQVKLLSKLTIPNAFAAVLPSPASSRTGFSSCLLKEINFMIALEAIVVLFGEELPGLLWSSCTQCYF